MTILNLEASYFAIANPLRLLERWFNRFQNRATVSLNQRRAEVRWTERAERAMQGRNKSLVVELQLYFSCVVKKRVLFHDMVAEFDTVRVNNKLELTFQPISSAVCGPEEFAARYPQGRNLGGGVAARMVPRIIEIDYRQGAWEGQFHY